MEIWKEKVKYALDVSLELKLINLDFKIKLGFVAAEESSPEYKQVDEREGALGSLLGMYRRNQQTFCAQVCFVLNS